MYVHVVQCTIIFDVCENERECMCVCVCVYVCVCVQM